MSEAVLDPAYWKARLEYAKQKELHQAIFLCGETQWKVIEQRHREILADTIKAGDSVLDAGCGWGRLLTLMPPSWILNSGYYLGIDLSPDFILMARQEYGESFRRKFEVGDMRYLSHIRTNEYDWAVLISIRPMLINYAGEEVWDEVERELHRVSRKILFLEYDVNDVGAIE